jgi:hypothetical protein
MPSEPDERIYNIPAGEKALIEFLASVRQQLVQRMAVDLKNMRDPTRNGPGPTPATYKELRCFLRSIKDMQMTPKIKQRAKVEEMLRLIYDDPKYPFPAPYAIYAKKMYEDWAAINWGAGEVEEEVESDSAVVAVPARSGPLRRPSPNHPIYGRNGIMRGILQVKVKTTTYMFDTLYTGKRDAKVFGHNGIAVGQWWPRQICALRDGAHGVKMGGIAGNVQTGAYSILVAAGYEGMDDDQKETLIYSGSDSHKNTNPDVAIRSAYTQCLETSLGNQRSVRVLRSSRGRHVCAPAKGLRYDGLYKVTRSLQDLNEKGGLYLKFKLVRESGQPPIDTSRPTLEEIYQESKVEDGY